MLTLLRGVLAEEQLHRYPPSSARLSIVGQRPERRGGLRRIASLWSDGGSNVAKGTDIKVLPIFETTTPGTTAQAPTHHDK